MFKGLKEIWNNFMGKKKKWYQGYFTPQNPKKCINIRQGKKPFARSSWETRMFNWCDENENVIEWGSEIIEVPYIFDIDHKLHKYIPDIWARIRGKDNMIRVYLLEIKPQKQTHAPKRPKNPTKKALKNYNYAKYHWIKNKNRPSEGSFY